MGNVFLTFLFLKLRSPYLREEGKSYPVQLKDFRHSAFESYSLGQMLAEKSLAEQVRKLILWKANPLAQLHEQ